MIDPRRVSSIVRHYASIPVAILCLSALALFASIGYRSILGPILGASIGALFAVFVLHVRPLGSDVSLSEPIDRSPPDYRVAGIITSLYVLVLIWAYRFTLHERPIVHYLAFGGFAGYIAYEIALGASRRRVVPELLVLTFFTYWSVQFAFPRGMFNADVRGAYLPVIRDALVDGTIEGWIGYLGHLVYALETVKITGLSPRIGYFVLAVLLLTGTLLVLAITDRILPAISEQTALYAALFFGSLGWTLGRGFRPGKLSFFYAMTLLLGFVVIVQYAGSSTRRRRWTTVGVIVGPAIVLGHRFSAGAAMVFVVSLAAFFVITAITPWNEYKRVDISSMVAFAGAYAIVILGTPIHQGPLLRRGTGLLTSLFVPISAGGGGPGRYSEVALKLLLLSTAGQAILFGLGVLGAAIAIRRTEWEFDLGIFWMAVLSVLLLVSLLFNAADVQPQRFYSLLGLFGLNVFAGIALVWLLKSKSGWISPRSIGMVVLVFAVLSLGSPVASMHFSFVSDDVPHIRLYETSQLDAGDDWVNEYQGNESTMLNTHPPNTELPYNRSGGLTATVNVTRIPDGYRYVYTQSATDTGIVTGGGLGLGDRTFVFMKFASSSGDDLVYSNGETTVHVRKG